MEISFALSRLQSTSFRDSGGSNGWLAEPEWLDEFVASLELPGRIVQRLLRKLPPFQGIPPHVDRHDLSPFNSGRRFHVPLVTHPLVTMRWPDAGEEYHLEAGWLYEVEHTQLHEVVNRAPIERIHLQVNVDGACS